MKHNNHSSFTLIELLVVISIVALLSSVVLASLNSAREKARIVALLQSESMIYHSLADSASALWDFDNDSPGAGGIRDLSGNGNDETSNSIGYTTDTPSGRGSALSFNLIGQGGITSMPPKNLPTTEITITAWIKMRAYTNWNHIVQHNWVNDGAWILMVGNDGRAWFGISKAGVQYNATSPISNPLSLNQWHFLVGTYDGSTVTLYVDGAKAATASLSGQVLNTTANIYIGSATVNADIDNLRIYSRALNS